MVGYTPLEFRDTLHMLAEGKVNAAPIVTGTVGLPGVGAAFDALANPGKEAKIIIEFRGSLPKGPSGKILKKELRPS